MLNTLQLFKEMDRFFHQMDSGSALDFSPSAVVNEEEDCYKITVSLPGVKSEDIHVELDKGVLVISGERKSDSADSARDILRERPVGFFEKRFKPAMPVNTESISAKYQDGILEIKLDKAEEAKPRKIEVK